MLCRTEATIRHGFFPSPLCTLKTIVFKPSRLSVKKATALSASLTRLGQLGNRLPDPLTLFFLLSLAVVVLSALFSGINADVVSRSGEIETKSIQSLLSGEGIRWMLTNAVNNFIQFRPLGPVLTVMIGIGIAERTGFIVTGLKLLVTSVPNSLITATIVFAGVMSSMVADAGYIVLTPLGALVFAGVRRHPLAGLAAAYAGVSGGYSANLIITGLDPMLAGLTEQAAQAIDPDYLVNAASNWYFMVASVGLITVIGTLVTDYVVEPSLGVWDSSMSSNNSSMDQGDVTARERKAFGMSMISAIAVMFILAVLALSSASPLRDMSDPDVSFITTLQPFFSSIEILITILFIIPGLTYGRLMHTIKSDKDIAAMGTDAMASMGSYIILAFVAGQFVAYFNWSNMGPILAVKGASLLSDIGLSGILLLLAFLVVSASMNIFVGSASAKWAFMAPVFVPMLMMMGFSPELVQAAYRVGDSCTNIISPLMPYLPIIIVFAERYDKRAGVGTLLSAMLPYSIAFLIGWSFMLVIWMVLGLPLGPDAPSFYQFSG